MTPRRLILATPALLLIPPPPAMASAEAMAEALRAFTGGATVTAGRVALDISPLVENGNTVPLSVMVQSPMTQAEHVRAIAIFNERNPQPHVVTARFSQHSGQAMLATNIRLATSQTILAVAAFSDDSFWSDSAQVIVTLAACLEG